MSDLINRLLHAVKHPPSYPVTGALLQEAANEICALKSRIEVRASLPEAPAVPVVKEGADGAPQRLWISFADLGEFQPRHIRQWQSAPFGGGIEYIRSALVSTPPAPTAAVDGEIALAVCDAFDVLSLSEAYGGSGATSVSSKDLTALEREIKALRAALSPGTADILEGEPPRPSEFLGRCSHCLDNAHLDGSCALMTADDCIIRRASAASPSPNDGEAKP
jgi:hypothetical protein